MIQGSWLENSLWCELDGDGRLVRQLGNDQKEVAPEKS
jgi:hypothetical protein